MSVFTPVYGERALLIGGALVVADLHIGIEHELRGRGAAVPSQARVMGRALGKLLERTGADELIVLGDVKHSVPSTSLLEHSEIPRLFSSLRALAEITLVKGNHDTGLKALLPGFRLHEHVEREGFLLAHGHAWIKKSSLHAHTIVLAHAHPAVLFVDDYGRRSTEPVWVRGRFTEKLLERYKASHLPEFVVMPAFNPLISGSPVNRALDRGLLGPFHTSGAIDPGSATVYLLDGTELGAISALKGAEEEPEEREEHGSLDQPLHPSRALGRGAEHGKS